MKGFLWRSFIDFFYFFFIYLFFKIYFEMSDLVHVWMIVVLLSCFVKWTVLVMSVVLKPLLLVSHILAIFGVPNSGTSNVSAHKFLCETFNSLLSVSSCISSGDFSLRITLFLFLGLPPCTCDATILQLQQLSLIHI